MYLSICTPTFNRAHTLERVYLSLIRQTSKNFEWILIDDGSTDGTKEMIEKWIKENLITIKYYYQSNKGKHIALNEGVSMATGCVFTCLDSDDWFYSKTVEKILEIYKTIEEHSAIAGIIGLDTYENGECIGTDFNQYPKKYYNWIDLIYKYGMKGDKAYFYKTNIIRLYDFPSYKNNKHMPPSYQLYQISKKYDFLVYDQPLKYVEYLEDGITRNKFNKYIIAADNFSCYRLSIANLIPTKKARIINGLHFNATQYIGKVKITPKDNKTRIFFFILKPFGYILGKYIIRKAKKTDTKKCD